MRNTNGSRMNQAATVHLTRKQAGYFGSLLLLGLLTCFLAPRVSVAQKASFGPGTAAPLSDALRARGIGTSEPSLISALANEDQWVRSLAALKLAEDHDYDAIPSIGAALKVESSPKARIAMSEALWGLHDPNGLPSLQAMCTDSTLSIYDRVYLVRHLNSDGASNGACAAPILRYLDSSRCSSDARKIALAAFPALYKWASAPQMAQIVSALQEMLADSDAFIRLQASHTLVQIGSRSSLPLVRDAASRETDPNVQSALKAEVRELEKNQ